MPGITSYGRALVPVPVRARAHEPGHRSPWPPLAARAGPRPLFAGDAGWQKASLARGRRQGNDRLTMLQRHAPAALAIHRLTVGHETASSGNFALELPLRCRLAQIASPSGGCGRGDPVYHALRACPRPSPDRRPRGRKVGTTGVASRRNEAAPPPCEHVLTAAAGSPHAALQRAVQGHPRARSRAALRGRFSFY